MIDVDQSCNGKIKYQTYNGAKTHLDRYLTRQHKGKRKLKRYSLKGRMNVYRCKICQGYHLGH